VLGWPGIFLNTVGDVNLLPRVLDAAHRFTEPPPDEEMNRFVEEYDVEPLFT
jgi:hypothetical protein